MKSSNIIDLRKLTQVSSKYIMPNILRQMYYIFISLIKKSKCKYKPYVHIDPVTREGVGKDECPPLVDVHIDQELRIIRMLYHNHLSGSYV